MIIALPRSRFRWQLAWVVILLAAVFSLLLFRDLYTGKIDLSLQMSEIVSRFALEIVIASLCIVAPYVAVLLLWPGQIAVDPETRTLTYVFSSFWIMGREYSLDDFRSIEVRSSDKKEAKREYYLLLRGKDQSLSFTFPDLKEATGAGKELAKISGLRNAGYQGVKR